MTNSQLIEKTAKRSLICKESTALVLQACFDIIRESLVNGDNWGHVRIDGFGTFYGSHMRAHKGKSPLLPGEDVEFKEKFRPRFSPTSSFNRDVMEGRHYDEPIHKAFQPFENLTERAQNIVDPRTKCEKLRKRLERRYQIQCEAAARGRATHQANLLRKKAEKNQTDLP